MSSKIDAAISMLQVAAYDRTASWHGEQLAPKAQDLTTPSFSGYGCNFRERIVKYRDDLYKRIVYPVSGRDRSGDDFAPEEDYPEGKIPENVRRAKKQIEAYALCNDWDYWATFTLRPGKYETRLDLQSFRRDVMQLLRNIRRETGEEVAALLVPELHKNLDGWHMHGLLRLPQSVLRPFAVTEDIPLKLKQRIISGKSLYDFPRYRASFGWVCVEPLENRDAAARYITKYVTKGLNDRETAEKMTKGQHLYYVTRGLKRPEVLQDLRCDVIAGTVQPLLVGSETVKQWDREHHRVEWTYSYPGGEVEWLRPARDRQQDCQQLFGDLTADAAEGDAMAAAISDMAAAETLEDINRVLYHHAGGAWCRLSIVDIQRLHSAADLRREEVVQRDNDTLQSL